MEETKTRVGIAVVVVVVVAANKVVEPYKLNTIVIAMVISFAI